MRKILQKLPERFRGEWCDERQARMVHDMGGASVGAGRHDSHLPEAWADALLKGDLPGAHKLWGKWQGYTGRDPWEDHAWREFWETQKFGEQLWDDFDASTCADKQVFHTKISYWSDVPDG